MCCFFKIKLYFKYGHPCWYVCLILSTFGVKFLQLIKAESQQDTEPTTQTTTTKVLSQQEFIQKKKRAPSKTCRYSPDESRLDPGNKAEHGRWGWKQNKGNQKNRNPSTSLSLQVGNLVRNYHQEVIQRTGRTWEAEPEINTAAPEAVELRWGWGLEKKTRQGNKQNKSDLHILTQLGSICNRFKSSRNVAH